MFIYYNYLQNSHNEEYSKNNSSEFSLPKGYSYRTSKPSLKVKINLLWYLFSVLQGKKFIEYQVIDSDNKVVSYARVIGKIYKFPFMKKSDLHIGPCFTEPHERGKGFYPFLLRQIQKEFSSNLYMIVDENNIPSIKGITKAGFKPFAKGHVTTLRKYLIDEYL